MLLAMISFFPSESMIVNASGASDFARRLLSRNPGRHRWSVYRDFPVEYE